MTDRLRGLRERMGPLWWYALLYMVVARVGDLINFLCSAFLVVGRLDDEKLGALTPLLALIPMVGVPMGIMLSVAQKYLNAFQTRGEEGKVKAMLRHAAVLATVYSAAAVLALLVLWPALEVRMRIADRRLVAVLALIILIQNWQAVASVASQSLKKFYRIMAESVMGPLARLVLLWLLIQRLQVLGYAMAVLGQGIAAILVLAWGLRPHHRAEVSVVGYGEHVGEMWRYFRCAGSALFLLQAVQFVETLAIRNFTSPQESGGYFVAALFGFIPLYLSGALTVVLFPIVSERHEQGRGTARMLMQSHGAMLTAGVCVAAAFFLGGGFLLGLREAWSRHLSYAPLIWRLNLVATFQGIILAYMAHENACRRFVYTRLLAPALVLEGVLLYGLMGWGFFRPFVPAAIWQAVDEWVTPRLAFAVWTMLGTRAALATWAMGHTLVNYRIEVTSHHGDTEDTEMEK